MMSCDPNFPVPTINRDVNSRPPRTKLVSNTGIPYHPRMAANVTLQRDGTIATVTLNRPDRRNALSDPMLTELASVFTELRDDASTRVVIVTGAPPVFSAGADAGLKS